MAETFSLVIPTCNRADKLRRCLAAATSQSRPPEEVIVVDDASTDGTSVMMRECYPAVRCLRQERRRGPAAARNRGIAAAGGDVVVFTDDDCLLPPDFLARLQDGYARYPQVAGAGGYHEADCETLATRAAARYERHLNRSVYGAREREYCGGFECPAGGTDAMSYRRIVLAEVGCFDETFRAAGGEDAALKWQVSQRGYRLLYLPIKVTHLGAYDLPSFWRQNVRRGRGAAHFELRILGRHPGGARIALRGVKRSLAFAPDLLRLGPTLAAVKLLAAWGDVCGQALSWREHGAHGGALD
jgi:GT2 family glycosyltransferase